MYIGSLASLRKQNLIIRKAFKLMKSIMDKIVIRTVMLLIISLYHIRIYKSMTKL